MKILVTGATGYLGSRIVDILVDSGRSIIATARNAGKAKTFRWFEKTDFIQYDLNERKDGLYGFFGMPDMVIHTAWDHLPDYHDKKYALENLGNSAYFIDNMIFGGLKNIAITGTFFEYGLKKGRTGESAACHPVTEYAKAKLALLRHIMHLKNRHEFIYKWMRLFNIYGKNDPKNSIISMLEKSAGNREKYFPMSKGDQVRDFLPVEKACEYIVKISLQDRITGIINCCSGRPVRLKKFMTGYIREHGLDIVLKTGAMPYNAYESENIWGDTAKLVKIPGLSLDRCLF